MSRCQQVSQQGASFKKTVLGKANSGNFKTRLRAAILTAGSEAVPGGKFNTTKSIQGTS